MLCILEGYFRNKTVQQKKTYLIFWLMLEKCHHMTDRQVYLAL